MTGTATDTHETTMTVKRVAQGRYAVALPSELAVDADASLVLDLARGVAYWRWTKRTSKSLEAWKAESPSSPFSIASPGKGYPPLPEGPGGRNVVALLKCRRCESKYSLPIVDGMDRTSFLHPCNVAATPEDPVNYYGEGDIIGWNQDLRHG